MRVEAAAARRYCDLPAFTLVAIAVMIIPESSVVPYPKLGRGAVRHLAVLDSVLGINEPERLRTVAFAPHDLELCGVGAAPDHLHRDVPAGPRLHAHITGQVVDGKFVFGNGIALDLLSRKAGGGENEYHNRPHRRSS
jgi:hypothetical protein